MWVLELMARRYAWVLSSFAILATWLAACGHSSTPATQPQNSTTAPQITTQPANQSVSVGQTATFSVVATGSAPLQYQWREGGSTIAGATASSYTTPATVIGDNGSSFTVVVSNATGSMTSNAATLTVTAAAAAGTDVVTYKYDVMRTGQNLAESALTPANVTSSTFGKLRNLMVDGLVDAQPLYLSKLTVAGAAHNVVFVATEHDSVYAFDADTGTNLWQVSLIDGGETTSDDRGCGQVTPEIGITSTPVIDRSAGPHGTIYVVAMTKDASSNYHQRLHALDVTTGKEMAASPTEITAMFGATTFAPGQYKERAALLLNNGTLYTTWASHCDDGAYGGWIIALSAVLARDHECSQRRAGCERQRLCQSRSFDLDERRRTGGGFGRQRLCPDGQRSFRDHPERRRIPERRGLRQLVREDLLIGRHSRRWPITSPCRARSPSPAATSISAPAV